MTGTKNTGEYEESPESRFRYTAFISYRHVEPDRKWAKWLHTNLETYRIPKQLLAAGDANRLGRVFRDEEELPASSDLSREIDNALEQSRFLIVICSPHTPESKWINQEIVKFRELGRHDRILALLVKGEPAVAFPLALREIRSDLIGRSHLDRTEIVQVEPLAADVRAIAGESERTAKRMAFLRIAAALLQRRFDDLRQRDQERKTRRLLQLSAALSFLLVGVGLLAFFALFQKQVADSEEEESEVVLVRFADGEVIWEGDGRWISFAPYPTAGYFFVWSVSGQDQLRNLADGAIIKPLAGALRHLDFRSLTKNDIFVAAFNDSRYELWDGSGSPALLRNLGFGLRGYLSLPNDLLLIWYENGNAYVIDLAWLTHISRNPDGLAPSALLDSLCSGLFAKSWFDQRTWENRRPDDTRACVQH